MTFKELEPGQVFKWQKGIFIKSAPFQYLLNSGSTLECNAVDLEDGAPLGIVEDVEVELVALFAIPV